MALSKANRLALAEALLAYRPKRGRGRPKGTVTEIVHEAADLFEQIKKEMHARGHKRRHGLDKKITALIIEKWMVKGRRLDERSLKWAVGYRAKLKRKVQQ